MVRIHPDPPGFPGAVAQLGERVLCKHEVVGSIPSSSTTASIGCTDTALSSGFEDEPSSESCTRSLTIRKVRVYEA